MSWLRIALSILVTLGFLALVMAIGGLVDGWDVGIIVVWIAILFVPGLAALTCSARSFAPAMYAANAAAATITAVTAAGIAAYLDPTVDGDVELSWIWVMVGFGVVWLFGATLVGLVLLAVRGERQAHRLPHDGPGAGRE